MRMIPAARYSVLRAMAEMRLTTIGRYVTAALLMLLLTAPSVGHAAARPLGSVRFIHHRLTVQPPKAHASPGRVRQSLYAAYGLRTASGDKASIGFVDQTVLHINQRTDLVLRSPGITVVRRGEVAALGKPGSHERILTASALASAIGTEFDVRIERAPTSYSSATFPPGTTTVSVVQGIVRVSNPHGHVTVTAGHWTHVPPGKAPTKPTKHNARGDVVWTGGLPPPGAHL